MSGRAQLCLGGFATLALLGCTGDTSYVVVRVVTSAQGQTLGGVAQFEVSAKNGFLSDEMTYPENRTAALSLNRDVPVTFSVSFTSALSGLLEVGVTPVDVNGTQLAYGKAMVKVLAGGIANVTVEVDPTKRPPAKPDGGTDAPVIKRDGGDLPDGAVIPDGSLLCDPEGAAGCGRGGTCALLCHTSGAVETRCTMAGARKHGELCDSDADCETGSQCFIESCGVKVCRKFCRLDNECGAGATCFTEITCGGASRGTGHKICSQACDPRGEAKAGCGVGLHCYLFPDEVVDCDCTGPTRIAKEGESCATSANCATGLLCVSMAGSSLCRPVCRLDSPTDCDAARVCERLINPTFATFGACLPR